MSFATQTMPKVFSFLQIATQYGAIVAAFERPSIIVTYLDRRSTFYIFKPHITGAYVMAGKERVKDAFWDHREIVKAGQIILDRSIQEEMNNGQD